MPSLLVEHAGTRSCKSNVKKALNLYKFHEKHLLFYVFYLYTTEHSENELTFPKNCTDYVLYFTSDGCLLNRVPACPT